jgi:hypothetical protein
MTQYRVKRYASCFRKKKYFLSKSMPNLQFCRTQ